MAVIWNHAIRKSVAIVVIPKAGYKRTIVGFEVFPDTNDPKLVKISVAKIPSMWEVEVFTLSTRVWKTVCLGGAPSRVCGVWKREDGANKTFSKIFVVKVEGRPLYRRILGFRNNGEVVIELQDADNYNESGIVVYEPLSGHTNGVGINGKAYTFFVRSYMETLLLLNESDSIIH
ncbi:hypothetical protein Tco_0756038 [Tanacetum coccineum]